MTARKRRKTRKKDKIKNVVEDIWTTCD